MALRLFTLALALVIAGPASAQIIGGQIDTFQSGTTAGWTNGGAAADPVNQPTDGPLGSGDRFLQMNATGAGPGGKLTMYNQSQWVGNYNTNTIGRIEADFLVVAGGPVTMRFLLKSAAGPSAPGYVSTAGVVIPADDEWHHAVFFLNAANMTALNGAGPLSNFLTNQFEVRFLHSAAPNTVSGDNIVGSVGIDNIQAIAVPEPGTMMLAGMGALIALGRVRRRCR